MPRIAIVRKDRCNPIGCGNYLCARVCPVNMEGKDCITPDPVTKKAVIDEHLCTGCGICPNRCPFEAIYITNLPESLSEPIHRYGRNGFHLYRLPVPKLGTVVGLIGRNGIGKSTTLKILSGQVVPNLGTDKDATIQDVIQRFKGTEAQAFFEKMRDEKIAISYKPQQVDLIPLKTKGKVEDLLRKVDERNQFDHVIDQLDLKHILHNTVETLSGGELQRVAIAACALKQATIYAIDEPTSYLDIKQRLRMSRFLRTLPNEETGVLLVDHDLIILDSVTDQVHLVYGKEAAYGIVSFPKTSREGINTYLSGFIRDENMRFRDKPITFQARPPTDAKKLNLLTSWSNITKKQGHFTLEAPTGSLYRQEVVGVLGENGIGKTTFIKILARVEKPDTGEIDQGVRVSYKPQYLDSASDEPVLTILQDAVSKYNIQLIQPLELNHLLTKPINQLSGGELQRVAIAKCLSQDAELYVLDEPSAYLDVEQRLAASKAIRDIAYSHSKTILVVDHDLLFIDYVSDRLLVCEGQPARHGTVHGPFRMEDGMNRFLKGIDLTFRRDPETKRPRANSPGSRLDREQKENGKLYYS